MSDDILHTGRADIHHPKGPLAAEPVAQQPLSRGDVPPDVRDAAWQAYLSEDSVTGAIDAAIGATYTALTSRSTDARDRILARHARRPDGKCVMCRWADGSVAEWPCPDYLDAQALIESLAAGDAQVRAAALHEFAASMRALAEQAPEESAAWPWTAYALAAVKAEEHAGKGFPSEQADRTPDVDTPDHSQRFWWHHGDHLPLDSSPCAPTPGTAEGPADQCVGCGAGWTTVAWRRGEAVPSLPEETPDA